MVRFVRLVDSLLHVLFVKVNKDRTHGRLSCFWLAPTHIRIDRVLGSILGHNSVGKDGNHGRRRVAHEFGTTGHRWDTVHVGVSRQEEFVGSFLLR
jgi:hypothetical protein